MWCIGTITAEYRKRMYAILALYEKPYNPQRPMICMDEKSKQLLAHTRMALIMKPGKVRKEDYEYERRGTRNIFVAVEPKASKRCTKVTKRRQRRDFAKFTAAITSACDDSGPAGVASAGKSCS